MRTRTLAAAALVAGAVAVPAAVAQQGEPPATHRPVAKPPADGLACGDLRLVAPAGGTLAHEEGSLVWRIVEC